MSTINLSTAVPIMIISLAKKYDHRQVDFLRVGAIISAVSNGSVLTPIVCKQTPNPYELKLVRGRHKYEAYKLLKHKYVIVDIEKEVTTTPVAKEEFTATPNAKDEVTTPNAKDAYIATPNAKDAYIATPVSKEEIAKPVAKDEIAKPVAKDEIAKPVAKDEIAKPKANNVIKGPLTSSKINNMNSSPIVQVSVSVGASQPIREYVRPVKRGVTKDEQIWNECLDMFLQGYFITEISLALSLTAYKVNQHIRFAYFLSEEIKSMYFAEPFSLFILEHLVKVDESKQMELYTVLKDSSVRTSYTIFANFIKTHNCSRPDNTGIINRVRPYGFRANISMEY